MPEVSSSVLLERQEAQDELVNMAIRGGLDEVYEHVKEYRLPVQPEITITRHYTSRKTNRDQSYPVTLYLYNDEGDVCRTAEEAYKAIRAGCGDEFERVAAFNAFSEQNFAGISLKTSGLKSEKSIREKALRRYGGDTRKVKDVARIMVIAHEPQVLDRMVDKLKKVTKATHNPEIGDFSCDIEPWGIVRGGLLKRTLTTRVYGEPAEVQFVPFQQEYVAGKINHIFYEIVRAWETYQSDPDPNAETHQLRKLLVLRRYNEAISLMNRIAAVETRPGMAPTAPLGFSTEDYQEVTNALNVMAGKAKHESIDSLIRRQPEEEQPASLASRPHGRARRSGFDVSPAHALTRIEEAYDFPQYESTRTEFFQNAPAFASYRDYLQSLGSVHLERFGEHLDPSKQQKVFPIPRLSGKMDDKLIEQQMKRLNVLIQMTSAYYMQDAPEDMRKLWVREARHLNQKQPGVMPQQFIDGVILGGKDGTSIESTELMHENETMERKRGAAR